MTGAPKNLYSFLGVSVTASPKEIKAAYRRLSMQYHPDRNPGADGYTEVFVKLGDAYFKIQCRPSGRLSQRFGEAYSS